MSDFLKNRSYAMVLGFGAAWLHGQFDWQVIAFCVVVITLVHVRSA